LLVQGLASGKSIASSSFQECTIRQLRVRIKDDAISGSWSAIANDDELIQDRLQVSNAAPMVPI
jgi:hypothetical protein